MLLFFQAEEGVRDLVRSRGLGDVYKRQVFGKPCERQRRWIDPYYNRILIDDDDRIADRIKDRIAQALQR